MGDYHPEARAASILPDYYSTALCTQPYATNQPVSNYKPSTHVTQSKAARTNSPNPANPTSSNSTIILKPHSTIKVTSRASLRYRMTSGTSGA